MVETIRAFVAVELQQEVKDELARVISALDRPGFRGLRTVRPEGVHLTLKFLGDVPESTIPAIGLAISQVVEPHRPFTVKVGGFGAYPSDSAPRVLWVGVDGAAVLLSMRGDIDESLSSLGIPIDRRRWSPHLTLARIRDGTKKADRRRVWEEFSGLDPVSRTMTVSAVSLIRNRLTPDGAVYRTLHTVALAGSGPQT